MTKLNTLSRLEFINKQLIDQNRELKETILKLEKESELTRARYNEKVHFFEHALSRLSEMEVIPKNQENAKISNFPLQDKIS